MKNLCVVMVAAGLVSLPRFASAAGMGNLSDEAKSAFESITKAKSSLNAGDTQGSDSYLAKAQGQLKSALDKSSSSGSAQATPGATSPSAPSGSATAPSSGSTSGNALSQAQSEGQKLDQGATNPSGSASGAAGSASGSAGKSSNSSLQGVYDQVTSARSALKSGDVSQAKSLLDKIPASPNDLLHKL
jgi:hypothetical protein